MPKATIDEPESPDNLRINKDQYLKQDADRKDDPQATLEHKSTIDVGSAGEIASIETEHGRFGSSVKPDIISSTVSKGNTTRNIDIATSF